MVRHLIRGVAVIAAAYSAALPAFAQSHPVNDYQPVFVIHDFGANEPGGPVAGLLLDKARNLYGTEASGNGAVFALSPPPPGAPYVGWKETVLHSFTGGSDGITPRGALLMDSAGNLYGTTLQGGTGTCPGNQGCGTIFELSPPANGKSAWTETILYSFTGADDGAYPEFGLAADTAGNLYGTTPARGANGTGTVFELSPPSSGQITWTLKAIYGEAPVQILGTPVLDPAGNLYAVTDFTAFMLTPPTGGQTSWTARKIADLAGYPGIGQMVAGLTMDSAGNLYGSVDESGVVFELSPTNDPDKWTYTKLASLGSRVGIDPHGSLSIDANGNLYGTTTTGGGVRNLGDVWKLAPNGAISILHKFTGQRDGSIPIAGVIIDSAGNLYGTSSSGGSAADNGAVWEIKAPH